MFVGPTVWASLGFAVAASPCSVEVCVRIKQCVCKILALSVLVVEGGRFVATARPSHLLAVAEGCVHHQRNLQQGVQCPQLYVETLFF